MTVYDRWDREACDESMARMKEWLEMVVILSFRSRFEPMPCRVDATSGRPRPRSNLKGVKS